MQNNRILWLDMANVLAMSCVVWFHIPSQMEEPIREWEYICVNIPFFLFPGYSYALSKKQNDTFRSHFFKRFAHYTFQQLYFSHSFMSYGLR